MQFHLYHQFAGPKPRGHFQVTTLAPGWHHIEWGQWTLEVDRSAPSRLAPLTRVIPAPTLGITLAWIATRNILPAEAFPPGASLTVSALILTLIVLNARRGAA